MTLETVSRESRDGTSTKRSYFGTDHLLHNIERRTVSSGLVRAISQGVQFVLTLVYNVVLARLLSPHQFGLVAMVTTVLGLLQIFRDMGLSTATIQRSDITHAQVSNLFWLNVAMSGVISLSVAAGAPVIAWFYHEPSLFGIALGLSAYHILSGLAGQHVALLSRQMRFVVISAIELGAMATGFSIGILMAFAGMGYWSLVAATLSQAALRVVGFWWVSPWRPQWPVRGVGTWPLVSLGANLTASGFLYSVSRGSDSLLIGRVYGSGMLGLYTRAAALLERPMQQLIGPIYDVVVPALSRLQLYPERYRKGYLQVFEALAIAGFLFVGLALPLAHPLTVTILGPRWEAAAIIFAGFSISAIYIPLSAAASWLYTSQGRGQDMLGLSFIEAGIMITAVLVGLHFGPQSVAILLSLAGVTVQLPLTFHIAGRCGPVSTRDLSNAFFRHLPVCLVVGAATWSAYTMCRGLTPILQLLACIPFGLLAATATIIASPHSRRAMLCIFDALREMRK